jgi:hypothetical protein
MLNGNPPTATVEPPPVEAPDAGVIDDARRRQRRHWIIGLLVFALVGGAAALAVIAISGSSSPATATGGSTPGGLPTGALATLNAAGPLAVGPNGALYVVDVARDRILVRLPDGRFRVVAGNGKVGFSGDGGPAVDAELSGVSDLAFSPSGALYIADGVRVRVIGRNGVIRTIAGDGQPHQTIANGTPALSAALGSGKPNPLQIALSPAGQLYIATGYSQMLRLTAAGNLDTVRAVVTSGPWKGPVGGWYPIAVDAHGNIDVGGGPSGWSIWQVAPNGIAHYVGHARGSGGSDPILQQGPNGAIYADTGDGIVRIEPHQLVPFFIFGGQLYGQYFALHYFAFSPNGTIYSDEIPGDMGYELHQQLVSVRSSRVSLLWQEKNATPK